MIELAFPQHLPAHANKAIDASMTNEPTSTQAVQNGLAVRIAGNDEIYPDQQTAVVLYSESASDDEKIKAIAAIKDRGDQEALALLGGLPSSTSAAVKRRSLMPAR